MPDQGGHSVKGLNFPIDYLEVEIECQGCTGGRKTNEKFELKLLQDDLGDINKSDRSFIGHLSGDIKIREVILYGNKNPRVFAQSIIPVETINQGLSKLGELGTKPLGDILFEKNIFKKENTMFAQFKDEKNIFWGRKTKYNVKNKPFSVMEVFLIDQDE